MNPPSTSAAQGTTPTGRSPELKLPPRRFSRGRRAFFEALQRSTAALGGRRFYRWRHLAPGRFRVRHEPLDLPASHRAFDGFRIVQWSDLHAGPFLRAGDLREVVEASNRLDPDWVVITGDLITDEPSEAFELLADFGRLRARLGVFGVFGNHDYRRRHERQLAERFEREAGVRFLMDASVRVERQGAGLALVGLEDLEEARSNDLDAARGATRPGDLEVVLCHNPGGAARLASERVLAVLSGHTHGHQLDLPLIRRLAPPHPGDRRQLGPSVAITSRGLGALGVPLRLRSPAELVVLDLRSAARGEADAR